MDCSTYSKKDVFGGVESSREDACSVWLAPVTHDPAGKPGDGALCDLGFIILATRNGIGDHEVDRAFC